VISSRLAGGQKKAGLQGSIAVASGVVRSTSAPRPGRGATGAVRLKIHCLTLIDSRHRVSMSFLALFPC
jgi:hypothetical protein